jgi:hypothetical protein
MSNIFSILMNEYNFSAMHLHRLPPQHYSPWPLPEDGTQFLKLYEKYDHLLKRVSKRQVVSNKNITNPYKMTWS